MIRLKFKEGSSEKFDHKPSGNTGEIKAEDVRKYINLHSKINGLSINDFDLFDNDDKVLVNVIYNKLHPKTSRYKFRSIIKDIGDIPQRDTKIFEDNGKIYLSIIYELTKKELEDFLNAIQNLFNILGPQPNIQNVLELQNVNKKKEFKIFQKIKNIQMVKKPNIEFYPNEKQYVQLYKVGDINYIRMLLSEYNINISESEIVDDDSIILELSRTKISDIARRMNWLIMNVYNPEPFSVEYLDNISVDEELRITSKGNEPIIGVIDSGFDKSSPLNSFVISNEDKREVGIYHDYNHGTAVSSLIIANDEINPTDQDGLGNFRVKHFEILEPKKINQGSEVNWAYLYTKIKEIVESNTKIKVWNLSFGGPRLNLFIISPHGLLLDKLADEYDCIFIIAAGNSGEINPAHSLASPADSINNISVGSVSLYKRASGSNFISRAYYSSKGYVLQSVKPDVSRFGGPTLSSGSPSLFHNGKGYSEGSGTSFSTPKVARFAAYLVDKGYSPQEAKSKIISLADKESPSVSSSRFGVVKNKNIPYEINQTISLFKKDIIIYSIKIPEAVEKIILTINNSAKPISKLGHESSIYDIKIDLCEYEALPTKIITNGEERHYSNSKKIYSSASEIKIPNEENLRFSLGKYSPSKKQVINWTKNKDLYNGNNIGIRIKRLDLHDVNNSTVINASINISFIGKNLDPQDFIEKNNVEIFVEQDVEVSI